MRICLIFLFFISRLLTQAQSEKKFFSIDGILNYEQNQEGINIRSKIKLTSEFVEKEIVTESTYFKLDSLFSGLYLLTITTEDYEDVLVEIKIDTISVNIGSVLIRKINDIETVTINVERPKISLESGKISLVVKDVPYFEGQKAIDIIAKIPGITVINGIILHNGIKVNMIRIDNVEYSIESAAAILNSLNNNEIEKISFVKESFSKEDASNIGGIIELITFKNNKKNHYINLISDLGYGEKFRNNQGISYSFSKKKINFSVALYRNDNSIVKTTNYNRLYNSTNLNLHQNISTNTDQVNYPIRLYFDYSFNKNHSFSLNYFGFPQKTNIKLVDFNSGARDSVRFDLQVNNSIKQVNFNNESVVQYTYTSDSLDFSLKLKGAIYSFQQKSDGVLDESNQCNYCSSWNKIYINEFNSVNSNKFVSLDFMNDLLNRKLKMNYGLKWSLFQSKSNQYFNTVQLLDSTKSFDNTYNENVYASYLELNYSISKKLKFNSGLRFELTDNIGKARLVNSTYVERNYNDFFPSIGLAYVHSKLITISGFASRKIERPNINQLAPSLLYFDSLSMKMGNPLLKPTYSNNFGIDLLLRKVFLFSLYHQTFKDYQFNIAYPFNLNSDVYVLSMFNYKQAKVSGMNISSPLPSFKGIKLYVQMGYAYREFLISDDLINKGNNFYFGFSPSFMSKNKRVILNSYLNVITPNLNGAFENEAMYKLDFGMSYCFLKEKNLKVGIHAYDIFNSYVNNVNASLALIEITGKEINDIQSIYLRVNYTLGIKGKEEVLTEKEDRTRLTD